MSSSAYTFAVLFRVQKGQGSVQRICVISGTLIFTLFVFNNLRKIFKAIPEGVNCVIHGTNAPSRPVRRMTQARNVILSHSAYSLSMIKHLNLHKIAPEMSGSAYMADLHKI